MMEIFETRYQQNINAGFVRWHWQHELIALNRELDRIEPSYIE